MKRNMSGKERFDWEVHKVKMDYLRRKCNPGYSRDQMTEQDRDVEWRAYRIHKGTDE